MDLLRCPISMELMDDPVTVATGVTYERKNIEKWLFTYKKSTCPATMQELHSFDLTPNHTLKRLISGAIAPAPPRVSDLIEQENLVSLLKHIETTPFKVASLKKLRPVVEKTGATFVRSGGIEALARVMSQTVGESGADFDAFRVCEEAVGVLALLPLEDEATVELLLKPELLRPMMMILHRGSSDARVHAIGILTSVSKFNHEWSNKLTDQDMDAFKSLLELLSDENISTRLSSAALDVLLEMVAASKKNRLKAIEAGAVCTLVELLPDAHGHKCERMLLVLKRLCQLPEGRSALSDHGLGVAMISKKILRVSETGTKLGLKILLLLCRHLPTEKVIDDMMLFGAVRKLLVLLQSNGRSSSAKEKAVKVIKLHGTAWRRYPCFPCELMDYLRC